MKEEGLRVIVEYKDQSDLYRLTSNIIFSFYYFITFYT